MNFFRTLTGGLLGAMLLLAACSTGDGPSEPLFEQAWVRPLPPGMKMTAGFGTLSNPGSEALVFVAFSSPEFGDVSLHRTENVGGVSKMREVDELPVGPGESAVLEPGGYHLMLMMPRAELAPGQAVTVVMTTQDGRSFSYEVPVERR